MMAAPAVILKIGGSLLDKPGLVADVVTISRHFAGLTPLLLIGGGAAAETVRAWDRAHQLGEEAAHWLALESLRLTQALAESLWLRDSGSPGLRVVRSGSQFDAACSERKPAVLCAACFCRWAEQARESAAGPRLPHLWEATSDSLAIWAARVLNIRDVVLVKSQDWRAAPQATAWQTAADSGLVDRCCRSLAGPETRVSWVNARSPALAPLTILPAAE